MPKFTAKDIVSLHNAGIEDDLIDKLIDAAAGKQEPGGDPNHQQEEQPKVKTASEILSGLLGDEPPAK